MTEIQQSNIEKQKQKQQPQENRNTSLIQALREGPNFLMEKYNQKIAITQPNKPTRAGGVYIPPHRLRAMQQQLIQNDPAGIQNQRLMWELLRKSINGIVNKVNISNIQNIVIQLFNENILRGKGLLSKAIIKAQMASPNFTHVYAALTAVINTKLPQIGNLIIRRVIIQFKRSYERNNKIVCMATTKMIAHLINQRVIGQYLGLQLLFILLNSPTEDSVQIACDFMIQAGQILSQITPTGANAIFQRFKSLLHQGQVNQKAQYSIQNLFAIRKTGFKEHPGVIPQLDLVELEDQLTHHMDFEDEITAQDNLNIFKFDPFYAKTQSEWDEIKMQILGQQNIINLKQMHNYEQEMDQQVQQQQRIQDLTQQDLINLRRTIYLAIQSTVNFEQCSHKILKMNIAKGYQNELIDMILQCCMMERIYQTFFGLLAQRFCTLDNKYKELFIQAFVNHYNAIFKLEANKIRNLGKLFGHLFCRFAIDWKIFQIVVLKPQTTTAAGRMFLKIIFKEIAQNLGVDRMIQQFNKQEMRQYYQGLFPIDNPNSLRFAINYYTSIGLGKLSQNMRQILALQEQIILNRRQKQQEERQMKLLKQQQQMMKMIEQQEQKMIEQQKLKRQQIQKIKEQNRRKNRQEFYNNQKKTQQRDKRKKQQFQQKDFQNRQGNQKRRQKQRRHRHNSSSETQKGAVKIKANKYQKESNKKNQERDYTNYRKHQNQRERSRDKHQNQYYRKKQQQITSNYHNKKQNYRQKNQQQNYQVKKKRNLSPYKTRQKRRESSSSSSSSSSSNSSSSSSSRSSQQENRQFQSQKLRIKQLQQQKKRNQIKEKQKQRQREKQKQRQIQKQKQRQRQIQRERQKQREKQRQRQRIRQKQIEREREKQKERLKQIQRQKEKIAKQKQKQKQRREKEKILKEKERKIRKQKKQKKASYKKKDVSSSEQSQDSQSSGVDSSQDQVQQSGQLQKKNQNDSNNSSQSQSQSNSSSQQQDKNLKRKNVKPTAEKQKLTKKKRVQSSDSQVKKKNKKVSSSDSESSSQSQRNRSKSSSSSDSSSETPVRHRNLRKRR